MRAGLLRQRVRIEQFTAVQDEYGQPIEAWTTLATVWASVEDDTGGERFLPNAEQRIAERLTRITIRERAGLTVKMRVVHGANIYQIERIERDPTMARQLVLWCSEVNP